MVYARISVIIDNSMFNFIFNTRRSSMDARTSATAHAFLVEALVHIRKCMNTDYQYGCSKYNSPDFTHPPPG